MLFLPTLYPPLLTEILYLLVFNTDPTAQFAVKYNRVVESIIIRGV